MKRFIVGTGVFPETLREELHQCQIEVTGFAVEREFMPTSPTALPVFALEDLRSQFPNDEIGVYLCLGYRQMNTARKRIFDKAKTLDFSILSFTHPSAVVLTENMGEGNLVFEGAVIGARCRVGKGNIFYPMSMMAHHSECGDFNFFAIRSSIAGCVTVGSQCFFGNSSCCKDHITIADLTLVGAAAYLDRDSCQGEVIVPARSVSLYKSSLEVL